METPKTTSPENGIQGLKHWRRDLKAGLVVSLVSLPLSLGIAIASGAPPIAGLISAIIAGLIFPFLGGAYVTISGPAAGLAPVLLAAMITLGGTAEKGYPLVLAVICIAGFLQVILSQLKVAKFSAMFPTAVVEGMLAAIGISIIAKQLGNVLGDKFHAHEFVGMISEVPQHVMHMNGKVALVAAICLVAIFTLSRLNMKIFKMVPPSLMVVVLGLLLGRLFNLESNYLIHIPDNPFHHGIVLPDFTGLFTAQGMWLAILTATVTIMMVDGIESLATIGAIDRIDPYKRKSNPDRTLFSMGISNMLSSLSGGLTIIPGGIKSTACIMNGGRTLWANFYNAVFLILYVVLAKDLINLIPLAALAAILINIGFKLCAPRVWSHFARIGTEQLLVFATTVGVTLLTDLLWGIIAGTVLSFVINMFFVAKTKEETKPAVLFSEMAQMFHNPISSKEWVGDKYYLHFTGPVVCFNALQVGEELDKIPKDAKSVVLDFTPAVPLVDHTSCCNLLAYCDAHNKRGREKITLSGLEDMRPLSEDKSCTRTAVHA